MKKSINKASDVSVAMCTYNGEKFLAQQLDSILNQSYSNIKEIICVDDNSFDKTWDILQEYAAREPRIILSKNENNISFISNFEKSISKATSSLIAISDQDDIWVETKIEKLVNAIQENMMCYSDNIYIDENNNPIGKGISNIRSLGSCTSCLNFPLYNGISGHTVIFRKELLKDALPFDKIIPFDYWLAFHASLHGPINYVNEALVFYRQHQNNTIGSIEKAKRKHTQETFNTN